MMDFDGSSTDPDDLILNHEKPKGRSAPATLPPPDRYNLTYFVFFLQGVGTLLPWNAFITVPTYFSTKLDGSSFQSSSSNYFTFGFQLMGVSALLFLMKFQKRMPLKLRVAIPMLIQLAVFTLTAVFVKTDFSPDNFFVATFVLVLISGAAGAFVQGGIFGLAGQLPFRYTQAVMSGQALGGFLISVLNIVTLAASNTQTVTDDDDGSATSSGDDNNIYNAALMFFAISVGSIALCFVLFLYMGRLEIVRYYRRIAEEGQGSSNEIEEADETSGLLTGKRQTGLGSKSAFVIFRRIKVLAFSVYTDFWVTLAVFPVLTASVKSTAPNAVYAHTYFIPLYCFVGFNLADWFGRIVAGLYRWPSQEKYRLLVFPVLLRFVFVALFALTNLKSDMHTYPLFDNDAWVYVFMMAFGFTNGYFGSLCMMYGPSVVDPSESELASVIMVLALNLGLISGSLTSFGIHAAVCQCNPFSS